MRKQIESLGGEYRWQHRVDDLVLERQGDGTQKLRGLVLHDGSVTLHQGGWIATWNYIGYFAGALACLLDVGAGQPELAAFAAQWGHDRLVMDKWFGLQVMLAPPAEAAALADRLTRHPDFDWRNPNRFRSVLGALSAHHAGFHHASGAGYRLLTDWLIRLDPVNPQTAARMSTAFETWERYDAGRQALARGELDRILARPDLSADLAEMAGRLRGNEDG
jgi:uncharacterized protein YjiS (DUF1127 family)